MKDKTITQELSGNPTIYVRTDKLEKLKICSELYMHGYRDIGRYERALGHNYTALYALPAYTTNRITELEQQLAIAVEALEVYANHSMQHPTSRDAIEALTKIRKIGE